MPVNERSPSPLTAAALTEQFRLKHVSAPTPIVLGTTTSTNQDAARLAAGGAPQWTVVTAEAQTAGRGRLDRRWESPVGASLLFSVVVRPPAHFPPSTHSWIPLIAGLAAVEAIELAQVPVFLKWPNDVVVQRTDHDGAPRPSKLAGLLAERVGSAVVIGVGINVSTEQGSLPIPDATSIVLQGGEVDRASLLANFMASMHAWWDRWTLASGSPGPSGVLESYRHRCVTIGAEISVALPDGTTLEGMATSINADGTLCLTLRDRTTRSIAAGDVVHVRRASE